MRFIEDAAKTLRGEYLKLDRSPGALHVRDPLDLERIREDLAANLVCLQSGATPRDSVSISYYLGRTEARYKSYGTGAKIA